MDDSIRQVELIEAEALVLALRQAYGYDFSDYALSSQVRRLRATAAHFRCDSLSLLQHRLLHEPQVLSEFLSRVNVSVSDFFRDSDVFLLLKAEVVPFLKTYRQFKVWHAGCAAGEELYSMAIMLGHAGILERGRLYGTDVSPEALDRAREGVFQQEHVSQAEAAYASLGYADELRAHFVERYGAALVEPRYRKRAVFADHNLVTDANFGGFELVCCRNVFIYFNDALQERVLRLFYDALTPGGYLCMGITEALPRVWQKTHFECVDSRYQLYRKRRGATI